MEETMTETTFEFVDVDSGQAGFCGIRLVENGIALALSHRDDGDLQVFLSLESARQLADLIAHALSESHRSGNP
jgi:hypothetical protein